MHSTNFLTTWTGRAILIVTLLSSTTRDHSSFFVRAAAFTNAPRFTQKLYSIQPISKTAINASSGKGFGGDKSKGKTAKAEVNSVNKEDEIPSQPQKHLSIANSNVQEPVLNDGQRALAELRRQRAEQRDEELRKLRDLLAADQQLQDTPAAIPEKVAQRMGKRMLPFVGVPLFLALGTFVGFWYFATYKNVEFQPSVVASVTAGLMVVSLLVRVYLILRHSVMIIDNIILTKPLVLFVNDYCSDRESLILCSAHRGMKIVRVIFSDKMNSRET